MKFSIVIRQVKKSNGKREREKLKREEINFSFYSRFFKIECPAAVKHTEHQVIKNKKVGKKLKKPREIERENEKYIKKQRERREKI